MKPDMGADFFGGDSQPFHTEVSALSVGPHQLLGDSGGVVNSLDFCPASLKSLGCFNFRCVLSSLWKAVTVNLRR